MDYSPCFGFSLSIFPYVVLHLKHKLLEMHCLSLPLCLMWHKFGVTCHYENCDGEVSGGIHRCSMQFFIPLLIVIADIYDKVFLDSRLQGISVGRVLT